MAKSQYPLTEFEKSLHGKISPNSIHQTVLAIRRAATRVGPDDLADPQMLAYYRASLPDKMRNVFGCAWNKFVAWASDNGTTLPETINMPKTRFVHPLWADITDMTSLWTPEAMERMTWSDPRVTSAPEEIITAARRAFTFFAERSPTPTDWLLPRRIDSSDPLPSWVIEGILRSDERSTKGVAERHWAHIVTVATRRGVTASELKQLYAGFWDERNILSRDPTIVRTLRRELDADHELPWAASHQRIVSFFRRVPSVGELIYW